MRMFRCAPRIGSLPPIDEQRASANRHGIVIREASNAEAMLAAENQKHILIVDPDIAAIEPLCQQLERSGFLVSVMGLRPRLRLPNARRIW
jgi:hypothetical protein